MGHTAYSAVRPPYEGRLRDLQVVQQFHDCDGRPREIQRRQAGASSLTVIRHKIVAEGHVNIRRTPSVASRVNGDAFVVLFERPDLQAEVIGVSQTPMEEDNGGSVWVAPAKGIVPYLKDRGPVRLGSSTVEWRFKRT